MGTWLHTSITVKETQMVKWTIFLEIIKTTLHGGKTENKSITFSKVKDYIVIVCITTARSEIF